MYTYSGFWIFWFNFIFIDQKTTTLSHTKAFSVLGYAILCGTFVWATLTETTVDTTLWLLFSVIVVGNRSLVKLLEQRKP